MVPILRRLVGDEELSTGNFIYVSNIKIKRKSTMPQLKKKGWE
jgi:hypothetical protein